MDGAEWSADATVFAVYSPASGELQCAHWPWRPAMTVLELAQLAQQQGVFPPEMDAAAALGAGPDSAVQGPWQIGVWGRPARADTVLAVGDRVECWRPLLVDPKTARHLRHAHQQAQGLGSKRRGRAPLKARAALAPRD